MQHKLITCVGYGNTGSSAITNFCEEFSNISSIGSSSFECTLFYENDGIEDLMHYITEGNRLRVDLAFKRFIKLAKNNGNQYDKFFNGHFTPLLNEYISSLNFIEWNGGWHRAFETSKEDWIKRHDYDYAKYCFEKRTKASKYSLYEADTWRPSYVKNTSMYYGKLAEQDFIDKTKTFFNKLIESAGLDSEYIVIDQLFPHSQPWIYEKYFDNIKAIVVDRDPRDLYFCNKVYWGNRYYPTDNVDIFIEWFKTTRQDRSKNLSKNILYVTFEDLIYNYNSTTKKIIDFLGLDEENHVNKRNIFNPDFSIINTRVWDKVFINDELYRISVNDDIKKIESELSEFCFDYSEYPKTEELDKKSVDFIFEKVLQEVDKVVENRKYSLDFCFFMVKKIVKKVFRKLHFIQG